MTQPDLFRHPAAGLLLGSLLLQSFTSCLADDVKEPAPAPAGDKPAARKADPLPRLPAKDLPPLTRQRPDPARSQFLREPAFVKLEERIRQEDGKLATPRTNVLEDYLREYLRRAGHPIAATPEGAAYRLEGSLDAEFHSALRARGQVVAWKYRGASVLRLLGRDGAELERFEVPELSQENVRSEESAALQLRREMAKLLWDKIAFDGKTLSHPEAIQLLRSLVSDPAEGDTATADSVVERLADIGFPAVPYLLEALVDRRTVRLPSTYPGLKGRNLDELRVYHLADKTLEEIFQKVSRMSISIGPEDPESLRLRRAIIKGWENEWRRFCRPFAESPQAPAARAGGSPAASGPAGAGPDR